MEFLPPQGNEDVSTVSSVLSSVKYDLDKLSGLASNLYNQGKYIEAEDILRKCLAMKEEVSGTTNVDTLSIMNNLAATLGRLCKLAEAEELFLKTLRLRQEALGYNHVDTLTTVNHIGVVLKQQNKLEESESYFARALQGLKTVYGIGNYLVAECAYNYAIVCVQMGNRDKAHSLFALSYKGLCITLGADHLHTLDALQWEIKCKSATSTALHNSVSTAVSSDYESGNRIGDDTVYISKNDWKHSTSCQSCSRSFSVLNREHHCRVCSRSVCNDCSSWKTVVYEFHPALPSRCCNRCKQQGF